MADDKAVGAPALDMNIESGNFDEKRAQPPAEAVPPKKDASAEDEEEDEDIDALIEDLESEDGHAFEEEEEETSPTTGGRVVPDDMLQTDSRLGLTESEVVARRRKYGLNQMKEEKENLVLKFLGFFVGPIQFVMEVSFFFFFFLFFFPFTWLYALYSLFFSTAAIHLAVLFANTATLSADLSNRVPPTRAALPSNALFFSLFRAWL
jgi:magnesium-transporting ATPase (P-type)